MNQPTTAVRRKTRSFQCAWPCGPSDRKCTPSTQQSQPLRSATRQHRACMVGVARHAIPWTVSAIKSAQEERRAGTATTQAERACIAWQSVAYTHSAPGGPTGWPVQSVPQFAASAVRTHTGPLVCSLNRERKVIHDFVALRCAGSEYICTVV